MSQPVQHRSASVQNLRMAVAIEQSEHVMAALMAKGIGIASLEIGRFTQPVIRVHYCTACNGLLGRGATTVRDPHTGADLVSVAINNTLVCWEQPAPAMPQHIH